MHQALIERALFLLVVSVIAAPPAAMAASTSYTLGAPVEMLDDSFYDNGSRAAWGSSLNHAGTQVAFFGMTYPSLVTNVYLVDVGDPSSWRRLTTNYGSFPQVRITWTPDDSAIYSLKRIDAVTGAITESGSTLIGAPLSSRGLEFTSLPSGNWMVVNSTIPGQLSVLNLLAVPVFPDGSEDPARDTVALTNLGPGELRGILVGPAVAPDGTRAAFYDMLQGAPDIGDIYTLLDVQSIIAAPKIPGTSISTLAPTTLSDPRIVPVRAGAVPDNYANSPAFSQDGSLVFFNEDWNNVFQNADFIGTVALADFDIMLARSDGAAAPFRFQQPGNQGLAHPTRGGTRVLFAETVPAAALPGFQNINFHLYMTALDASTGVDADSAPLPESATEVVIGGQPQTLPPDITLTDSAVQLTAPVQAADASGTSVSLPQDQVVNFPAGTVDKAITISTPVAPVSEDELPPGAPMDSIRVLREFGPAGTIFFPPVAVTITYTDAEVAGLNEATLRPYLYNTDTLRFDIPVPESDIVSRDPANNRITFLVSHFSVYGIGGNAGFTPSPMPGLPAAGNWTLAVSALLLALAAATALRRKTHPAAEARRAGVGSDTSAT